MGLLKWLYEEVKDSVKDVGYELVDGSQAFYRGYIKNSDNDKADFRFSIHSIGNALSRPFRNIKKGLSNFKKWYMVIWEDRDFDYSYMEVIFRDKLKNMEDYFYSKDTHIEDAVKYANEIKEAREILDDLISGDYEDKILAKHYDKYPIKDDLFEKTEDGCFTLPKKDKEESESLNKALEEVTKKEKELRARLYKILNERSIFWWD